MQNSVDIYRFHSDLQSSSLITSPPASLGSLLFSYNATLSSLLDIYAPVITEFSKRSTKSNPWFSSTLRAFRSTVRCAENLYKHTDSAFSFSSFKSFHNCYHKLILSSRKKYYTDLVSSFSDNSHYLWQTVNKLLHLKSSSSLPSCALSASLTDSFASFFTNKIHKLCLSLAAIFTVFSPHLPLPPVTPLLNSLPSDLCSNQKYQRYLLTVQTNNLIQILFLPGLSVLVHTITNIVNLSLSSSQLHPILKESTISPLIKKSTWLRISCQTTAQSPTFLSYPESSNVLSNLDLLNTFLLTIFSTLTSLGTVNITPMKLVFSIFMVISLMPSALRKYPVFVFLTSQQLLTPLVTTS